MAETIAGTRPMPRVIDKRADVSISYDPVFDEYTVHNMRTQLDCFCVDHQQADRIATRQQQEIAEMDRDFGKGNWEL